MFDFIEYTKVEGSRKEPTVIVYALSTCGFCKRGLAFLRNHSFEYSFVYMDLLPLETKNDIKGRLKDRFKADIAFPFVVIDDKEYLVGFIEVDWKKTLKV